MSKYLIFIFLQEVSFKNLKEFFSSVFKWIESFYTHQCLHLHLKQHECRGEGKYGPINYPGN